MAQGSEGTRNPALKHPRVFLFLQGPISPFFARVGSALRGHGHRVLRINLCFGDRLFWRAAGARNYRGTLADWPAFIAGYLDREGVTDVVLLGEQRAYHRAAIAAARERGIAVTVTDFGYLRPDFVTLERNGMNGDSELPREPRMIQALSERVPEPDLGRLYRDSFWTMAIWDMIYHLSSSLLWFTHPGYRSHQLHHPVPVYLGTGWRLFSARWRGRHAERLIETVRRSDGPYFFFPLQMATDFSIRAYSHYPDLQTAISEVLASFARMAGSDTGLVVKAHPLDPGLVNWRRYVLREARRLGVGARVHYIDGGALDRLIEGASGVVTINSTVGLRALMLRRPVLALAQAVYRIEGLTYSGPLDAFWRDPGMPDHGLCDDFVRALNATVQLRGTFYGRQGLEAATAKAVERLHNGWVNEPLPLPRSERPASERASAVAV